MNRGCESKKAVGSGGVCGDTSRLFVIVEVPESVSPSPTLLRLCAGNGASFGGKSKEIQEKRCLTAINAVSDGGTLH